MGWQVQRAARCQVVPCRQEPIRKENRSQDKHAGDGTISVSARL